MTKKILSKLLALVCTVTISLTGCASNTTIAPKTDNKEIQAKISKYVESYSSNDKFSGSILVAKDGEVLLAKGYGMADYDKNIVNESQTVFGIGSITKQFTATAIMMLQEEKLLNVEDKIDKYIPDYPNGDKIKIHNLLTHTSGIPEYLRFVKPVESGIYTATPEEIIDLFKNQPLNFDAGTTFQYSNSNYILLGYIIEKVSGTKYEEFLEKNIFKPLDLKDTSFISRQDIVKNKAIGYSNISKTMKVYTKEPLDTDSSCWYSAGGISSTIEDLYKWSNSLDTEKLIKKESLNKMFTPYLNNYGYGWGIEEESDKNKIVSHAGKLPGYSSFIKTNIDKKYVIIILSNQSSQKNQNSEMEIYNMVSGLSKLLEIKQ